MSSKTWRARTRRDLIVEVWEQLDRDSVGAEELNEIQSAIQQRFGIGAVDSPAAIARLLADEGAALRHPEVLEFDTAWREHMELANYRGIDFGSLSAAAIAIEKLDALQKEAHRKGDKAQLWRIAQLVSNVREDLLSLCRSKGTSQSARAEAKEIAEWLLIWQRTPELFSDWRALRIISMEFVDLFPDFRIS
ncbi:MAG TPA: hypothetical protein VI750_05065 [Pyrinomonadaceae bacterium]|nr:hypothetical protein [Pyrinomonadaceae bacterium]